ncbi:hypothetical protein AMJ49_03545 [Parcubacteria bacterium DG_74_2]|nr:MAG: hypothetical protein AMJ49_03545 [Parcubacteria bacterium DG_74_2]
MVVRNTKTGKKGITVDDFPGSMSCCLPEETPVVYEGDTASLGTLTKDLEVIGPENAIPDPKKCGAGKGKQCCIFLVVGPSGFQCQRFGSDRWNLIFNKAKMTAQREPTELYPHCQLEN